MKTVFVDGSSGITGKLLIQKLIALQNIYQFNIRSLDDQLRKDEAARYREIKNSDIAILCLPEDIAAKTMKDLFSVDTVIIDISAAHRADMYWNYGFPELYPKYENTIKSSKRIANPGCFATGVISLLNPLVRYLNSNYPLIVNGVTGYSAGGTKGIQKYLENPVAFRVTHLNQVHRHVPEILHVTKINNNIMFNPCVAGFKNGQMVQVTLFDNYLHDLALEDVKPLFYNYYNKSSIIHVKDEIPNFISPEEMKDTDEMNIYIGKIENSNYIQLIATYDNLGKGSIGAAIQNLKILLNN